MAVTSPQGVIDAAWGTLPASGRTVEGAGRYTFARMERIVQIVVAVGCLAIGGQGFFASLDLAGSGISHGILRGTVFVSLLAMTVLCIIGWGARIASAVFAILFPVSLVLFPFVTAATPPNSGSQPWPFYLISLAATGALVAFRLPWQYVWAIGTPLLYAAMRLWMGGFAIEYWIGVGYDISVAVLLNLVIITVGWVLRSLGAGVDAARVQAVLSYARAASADAGEQERVAVAALMHDSVLAALIAAERARTPREHQLAVSMAREALTRLANAESDDPEGSDEPVGRCRIADDIERSARELGVELEVERVDIGPEAVEQPVIPGRVARAIVLAATQAVANAVQHAEGAGLRSRILRAGRGVRVEVSDSGPGVDVALIPSDRLGIRASIFARMTAVGGEATIESSGRGTTVALTWTGDRRA